MDIVVQKFGGTSVSAESSREHCVRHVKEEIEKGNKVIVVVSAMGRKGDPYATDTLLSLLGENASYLPKREIDLLMSTGELISSTVFSTLLHRESISNTILTGGQAGIRTDNKFSEASIIGLHPERLLTQLETHDVIVVPGFQGETDKGDTTTLGRGGSDTTATAIGAGVHAKYVDIFTDVEGIMTADPRIVEDAKTITDATYNEIFNLAYLGAKVIHPRAVEFAMTSNIPIRIRSTFSSEEGTLVCNKSEMTRLHQQQTLTSVTYTKNLLQLTIEKERFENIFSYFSEKDISIDFIQTSPTKVSFTLPLSLKDEAMSLLNSRNRPIEMIEGVAKISLVGEAMKGIPGVMSKAIETLYQHNIDVLQTSDSHTTIWFLVLEKHMEEAVCALHQTFFA